MNYKRADVIVAGWIGLIALCVLVLGMLMRSYLIEGGRRTHVNGETVRLLTAPPPPQ